VNGLEIGAALTGLAALVTAICGGIAALRQAGREDRAYERGRDHDIERLLRLLEERDRAPHNRSENEKWGER
jgi:hypothetical protein